MRVCNVREARRFWKRFPLRKNLLGTQKRNVTTRLRSQ